MVVVFMLFVFVAWDRSAFRDWFGHAGWNDGKQGVWLADLFLPWFLFIAGVAIPFSIAAGRGRDRSTGQRIWGACRRCVILYLLSCLIVAARGAYSQPLTWSWLLSWDDLQIIAFAYLIAFALYLGPQWTRITFIIAVLLGKWIWLKFVPIPGTAQIIWTQEQSTHRWLNAQVGWLGGFQNVLPAACTVLLGSLAGDLLRREDLSPIRRVRILALGGTALLAIAFLWRLHLPFSQIYCTSSYALMGAGSCALLLAGCYWLFDVSDLSLSRIGMLAFEPLGRNAIIFTFGAEFIWGVLLSRGQVLYPNGMTGALIGGALAWLQHFAGNILGAWAFALGYVGCWWVVALLLYRHRIFLKV